MPTVSKPPKDSPRGVYVMLGRDGLLASSPLLGNPAFGGFRLFANWGDLQPSERSLDLSRIESAAALAGVTGQKLLVSVNFGKGAGEWVYGGSHPCTRFPFDMKGQPAVMPLGFEEQTERKINDFVGQLARQFDNAAEISGFVMTGASTLGVEFHVVQLEDDVARWEEAARQSGFADKHQAIQQCAIYRMDHWASVFSRTTLLFCGGNPWSNQSGKQDEEVAFAYAKDLSGCGICTEYLKGNPGFTESGQVLAYPYCEEPVAPTSSPDSIQGTLPAGVDPVHCVLMTAYNKGAQMCELWEADCLKESNWPVIAADSERLVSNCAPQ